MFYLLSFIALTALVVLLMFYHRAALIPHLPSRVKSMFPRLGNYTPLSTFAEQANAGLSSSAFDLEQNLDGDSRVGLDERGTQEVMEIMRRERVTFDQARLIRHNRILARNGIDPSGMPLDSKAVTRL
ncbi:hypothetical protein BD410DRAFT_786797 [Rickenella mellea]|uniref:Uncharacterized protein n=1 Tax=Rickenella mellea TaxID=50990 RepID=A0A4Y7Q9Y5_9AGAM|nr:hypothetical protein BD410DRAFT_786797 [Rickenella mellea]